ncbi:MAG: acyl-CoA thioesterase, partial [Candidatus Binatia bacterium]
MPRVYRARITVLGYEIDAFGELYPSTLARFLQQVAVEASADAGFPDAWYAETGTIWLIRRSTIEYLGPARAGDVLEIATQVADFRRVRSRREYEVRRLPGGERIAVAHSDWVYVDRTTGRLARIPPGMIEAFLAGGEPKAL